MTAAPALHIVSGKGGTGKSTVATALAIALAEAGQRVLLAETEGRASLAPLLGIERLAYDEHRIHGPWSGELWAQSIEPAPALVDYVRSFFPLPGAAAVLQRSGASTFVTALAPGLKDVLITGKFCEAARRKRGNTHAFDAVVVDAPPTGRVHQFLNVTAAVLRVSPPGNVRAHAERIANVIQSDSTRVHLVVNDDDAAVQEAIEAVAALRTLGIGVGTLVCNRRVAAWPVLPSLPELAQLLAKAGSDSSAAIAEQLITKGRDAGADADAAREWTSRLQKTGSGITTLPEVMAATVADLPLRLAKVLDANIFAGLA